MSSFWTGWSSFKETVFTQINKAKVYTSKIGRQINEKIKNIARDLNLIKVEVHEKTPFEHRREESDALFDPKFLADKIYLRTGDSKKALKIVESLEDKEDGDPRFNGHYKTLSCDLTQVKQHLEEKKNQVETEKKTDEIAKEEGIESKNIVSQDRSEKDKKLQKWVGDQLVGLIQRKDISVQYEIDRYGRSCQITQTACHATSDKEDGLVISLSDQKSSVSAELPKYERNVRTVANTAALISEGEVIAFRSAKTHKKHLQEQRSKADIAIRAQGVCRQMIYSGLTPQIGQVVNGLKFIGYEEGKPVFEYQPVLLTMLDSSVIKGVVTSLTGIKKGLKFALTGQFSKLKTVPVENERKFLAKMKQENQDRFKGEFIEYKVAGDLPIIVREKPAIIQNYVFSSLSKMSSDRSVARQENIPGQIQMFEMMISKNPDLFDEGIRDNIKNQKSNEEKLNIIQEAIKSASNNENASEIEKSVLRAFHVQLFGKDLDGKDYDLIDSSADLAIFLGMQTDYLGLCFSSQCKSGHDRTTTATALKCASKSFFQVMGKYFDPSNASEYDKEIFRDFYTKSVTEFGFSNAEASRGPVNEVSKKTGLKIRSSPSANKYLNKDDEELKKRGLII